MADALDAGVAAQSNAYSHAGRQITSEVGRQNLNFGESSEGKSA